MWEGAGMNLSENCQRILCGVAVAGAIVTTAALGVSVAAGVLELVAGGANLALAVRREQQDRCDKLLKDVRKRLRKDYGVWLDRECRNHPDRKAEIEDAFASLDGVMPLIKPTTIDLVEAGLNGDRLFAAMQARLPAESPFRQQGIHRNVLKTVVINTFALVRTDAAFAAELTSLSFERVFESLAGLDAKLDKVLLGQLELKLLAVRHHNDVMEALAREKGVDPENLRPLFEAVGHDVPAAEFEHAVCAAVAELLARSREVPQAFNDPEEIARAIAVARDKLSRLDTDGAVEHLRRARAEQAAIRHERQRGEARLAMEEADILSLAYRFDEAVAAYETAGGLDPENAWAWFQAGDVHVHRGRLAKALAAYERGKAAAEGTGDERDVSVACNKIGDVERRLGNGDAALDAYRKGLAIREALALRDPANAEWQRDLSVSLDRIGDVELRLGNGDAALDAHRKGLSIAEALALRDPANTEWQRDLSISLNKIGDVELRLGNGDAALDAYRKGLDIREALARRDPANTEWQRDLSVSLNKIGDVELRLGNGDAALDAYRKGLRRRRASARQRRRRPRRLPQGPHDCRGARPPRPGEHRMAARSLDQPRQDRRRRASARQRRRRARRLPQGPRHPRGARPPRPGEHPVAARSLDQPEQDRRRRASARQRRRRPRRLSQGPRHRRGAQPPRSGEHRMAARSDRLQREARRGGRPFERPVARRAGDRRGAAGRGPAGAN
jgi:tetratricopeptide (TPR) repeat protein